MDGWMDRWIDGWICWKPQKDSKNSSKNPPLGGLWEVFGGVPESWPARAQVADFGDVHEREEGLIAPSSGDARTNQASNESL